MNDKPKRVPIKEVKELAQSNNYDFAVTFMWSSETGAQNVATWGQTLDLCDKAADLGNKIKKGLGWPEKQCNDKTARQKKEEKLAVRFGEWLTNDFNMVKHGVKEIKELFDLFMKENEKN